MENHPVDLPLFLNAAVVAKALGVAPSSVYEQMHEADFPVLKISNGNLLYTILPIEDVMDRCIRRKLDELDLATMRAKYADRLCQTRSLCARPMFRVLWPRVPAPQLGWNPWPAQTLKRDVGPVWAVFAECLSAAPPYHIKPGEPQGQGTAEVPRWGGCPPLWVGQASRPAIRRPHRLHRLGHPVFRRRLR